MRSLQSSSRLAATLFCSDDPEGVGYRVAAETRNVPILLGLDGVSDTATTNLMSCLAESGVLVLTAGTSRKPMVVQQGDLIFRKGKPMRGFWLRYWYQLAW